MTEKEQVLKMPWDRGSWHASALAGGYMAATAMHVHK